MNLRAGVRACGVMATVVSWLLQRHAACPPAWPQQTLRAAASRPERTHRPLPDLLSVRTRLSMKTDLRMQFENLLLRDFAAFAHRRNFLQLLLLCSRSSLKHARTRQATTCACVRKRVCRAGARAGTEDCSVPGRWPSPWIRGAAPARVRAGGRKQPVPPAKHGRADKPDTKYATVQANLMLEADVRRNAALGIQDLKPVDYSLDIFAVHQPLLQRGMPHFTSDGVRAR